MQKYDLEVLFRPETIALVGASENSNFAKIFENTNRERGNTRKIFYVNPRRETVFGEQCYPNLSTVPEPVDVAVISIPAAGIMDVIREGIKAGVKHFVVNTAGFAEASREGAARQQELKLLCEENGVGLIGPNCLGLINVKDNIILYGAALPACLHSGNVGAITQSGSISIALMNNGHQFGFSYIASTGNEVVLSTEDLLEFYVDDPATEVIALFLEGIHNYARFMKAAFRAREAGKPIVALKAGLTERGKRISKGHTGALAGSGKVNEAVLRKAGIIQVYDIDEMMATLELLSRVRKTEAAGVAVVSISGGELGIATDMCERFGIRLADFTEDTKKRVRSLMNLGELVPVMNPYDAGAGWVPSGYEDRLSECLQLLLKDENVDMLVILQQSQASIPPLQVDYYHTIARAAAKCFRLTDKAMAYTSNVAAGFNEDIVCYIRDTDMPLMQTMTSALKAVAHLGQYNVLRKQEQAAEYIPDPSIIQKAIAELPAGQTYLGERLAKAVLSQYGIPVTKENLVATAQEAAAYAQEIGYPVVLKIDSPDIIHKSDVGGVTLNLNSPKEVHAAYEIMMERVRAHQPGSDINGILVCEQLKKGTELILGVNQDEQFGPVIMVGIGGVMVEALNLVQLALPPFTKEEAIALLQSFPGAKVMQAFRGKPRRDIEAVADVIIALGKLGLDGQGIFAELDINPLVVYAEGGGCCVADARIICK